MDIYPTVEVVLLKLCLCHSSHLTSQHWYKVNLCMSVEKTNRTGQKYLEDGMCKAAGTKTTTACS